MNIQYRIVFVMSVTVFAYLFPLCAGAQPVERMVIQPPELCDFLSFGSAIAIDDEYIAVTARRSSGYAGCSIDRPSVYLFNIKDGALLYEFVAPEEEAAWAYGSDIALHGGRLFVGYQTDSSVSVNNGSVIMYDTTTGREVDRLTPRQFDGGGFGYSLDMNGEGLFAVGNPAAGNFLGNVYLYDINSIGLQSVFRPSISGSVDSPIFPSFGIGLNIDGDLLVGRTVGGHTPDAGPTPGWLHIYDVSDPLVPTQLWSVEGSEYNTNDGPVLKGEYLIVPVSIRVGQYEYEHEVRIFESRTGVLLNTLDFTELTIRDDGFGDSFAVYGDTLFVSYLDMTAPNPYNQIGKVLMFDVTNGDFRGELQADDASVGDQFGYSIKIYGNQLVVSANGAETNGFATGKVYIYGLVDDISTCPADLTGDGTLNFFDISAFLEAFAAKDPIADFTGNGTFNFFDISAFLEAFAAGCP